MAGAAADATTDTVHPALRLAVLNNLGEVYFQLHRFDDMVIVYDHMQNLRDVDVAVLTGGSFLDGADARGFLWNMCFF